MPSSAAPAAVFARDPERMAEHEARRGREVGVAQYRGDAQCLVPIADGATGAAAEEALDVRPLRPELAGQAGHAEARGTGLGVAQLGQHAWSVADGQVGPAARPVQVDHCDLGGDIAGEVAAGSKGLGDETKPLRVGGALERCLAGDAKVVERLAPLFRRRGMVRDILGGGRDDAALDGLQQPSMNCTPAALEQAFVRNVPDQRVLETVDRVGRHAAAKQQLRVAQQVEAAAQRGIGPVGDGGQ